MPDHTTHERYMKRTVDRNGESSVYREMSDTIDRTTIRRNDKPKQRTVYVSPPPKYVIRPCYPSDIPKCEKCNNENKHQDCKAVYVQSSVLLERLEQILLRTHQLETLKNETAKLKENSQKQERAEVPQINLTIPFFDTIFDSIRNIEHGLTILNDEFNAFQIERKRQEEEQFNGRKEYFKNVADQFSDVLAENKAIHLKIQEELTKLREEKALLELSQMNLTEKADDHIMLPKHSSTSSVFSPPAQIENGTEPSKAVIHVSPERNNMGASVHSLHLNSDEEEIEL